MPTRTPNGRTQPGVGRGRPPSRTAPRPASEPAARSGAVQRATAQGDGTGRPRGVTLRLPFMTARLEPTRHALNLPEGLSGRPGAVLHSGRMALPSPGKTLYYAGLGALVATQIVEWPVAAAIAVSTYVAQHTRPDNPALPKPAPDTGAGGGRAPSTS